MPDIETKVSVLLELHENLHHLETDPNRSQLEGLSPDKAFDWGYRSAIMDLEGIFGVSIPLQEKH